MTGGQWLVAMVTVFILIWLVVEVVKHACDYGC